MAYLQNLDHSGSAGALDITPGVFILDDTHPRASIVHVFGEATFADTGKLESTIVGAIRIGRPVVLDLRECTYLDCAAIGIIVRAAKNLGDQLRLVLRPQSQSYRMLQLAGLVQVLPIFETLDGAIRPPDSSPVASLRGA